MAVIMNGQILKPELGLAHMKAAEITASVVGSMQISLAAKM